MTFIEFCLTVKCLCRVHRLSVRSWGRTPARNKAVGGLPNSWHLDWMAVDVIPDDGVDASKLKREAELMGLDCVLEVDHVHLEPAGPRTSLPAG